jgi:hypothetical protein
MDPPYHRDDTATMLKAGRIAAMQRRLVRSFFLESSVAYITDW